MAINNNSRILMKLFQEFLQPGTDPDRVLSETSLKLEIVFRIDSELWINFKRKAMKKFSIPVLAAVLLLLAPSASLKAQSKQPPDAVVKSYTVVFPNAKLTKWDKEKDGSYEAEFTQDGQEHSATFTPDGTLKETETELKKDQVPAAVLASVVKDHPGAKVNEYARIVRANKSVVYEVEVKINGKAQDLLYTEGGQKAE